MYISSLRLLQFRNYPEIKLQFSPSITVLSGKNGCGKTNILEALYVSSVGKSHRVVEDFPMIQYGTSEAAVTIEFEKREVPHTLHVVLPEKGRKTIKMDGNPLRQKELIGTIQTVFFSPEDLQIVKGAPQKRRHFLDLEISQTNKVYYDLLLKYQRVLKQRNTVLKKYAGQKHVPLDEWTIQLAELSSGIMQRRLRSLEKMTMLSNLMHRKLTDGEENLSLVYEQPYAKEILEKMGLEQCRYIKTKEEFYEAFKLQEDVDRRRMTTTIGPHRDDFLFMSECGNLRFYGSQGQQRTAALALKLSELEFIKSEIGEYPVLLLDDVLSELDQKRRENLIQYIRARIQTFITTTDIEDFKDMKDVTVINPEKEREAVSI